MSVISSSPKTGRRRQGNGYSKIIVLLLLILICIGITYYAHFIRGIDFVFTHFFYVPIVVAAFWWGRRAIWVALFLGGWLLTSHYLSGLDISYSSDLLRFGMFVMVSLTVGIFREQAWHSENAVELAYMELEQIFNTAGSGMRVIDKDFNVLRVNETFSILTGVSKDKTVGKKCYEVFGGPSCHTPNCTINRILSGQERVEYEVEKERNNGIRIPCILTATSFRGPDGELIGIVEYFKDITSRKQAEGEIRRLNEELELKVEERTKELAKERDYTRHLIESSPDFQMTLDKDGRITDVNEAFEEVVGKSRKDVIGTSIYEYLPREETEKAIAEIFEKKKVRSIEIAAKVPGKGDLICSFSGTVFTAPEGGIGIYATGRDITEQRSQQAEILEKERQLAHASRLSTLGEMATAMAHEINQPLTLISMAAESILRDIKKKRLDMSLLPQDTEDILHNVRRIDRIITHMRTYARQPGEIKVVEPEQILSNAFIVMGEQLRVHDISVSRHIEEALPPIEADPNQLEQIFLNILTNARQALDEKGKEAERAGRGFQKQLKCSILQEGDYVVFEFADNGYGVPDEIKPRIFEPFFTTKEPGQGTGLGLSIAYSIVVQSHKGRIWVEDNEMGGATFKVALPIKYNKTINTSDAKR